MMEGKAVRVDVDDDDLPKLPPGFRFHPTDEEIISCYLTKKVLNTNFTAIAIGEVDLNKCEPWDLPKKSMMEEKESFFFCQKDRKYPTGVRTNRATTSGYWKATGKDKEIFQGKDCLVGMKKTLVFYKGRAPNGEKMNWVMHEYRLAQGKLSSNIHNFAKDEWAVCKIFHKNTETKKEFGQVQGLRKVNSFGNDQLQALDYASLPPLLDPATCFITQNPGSLEGSYLDCFPSWPSEYPSINPPVKMSNHYYNFGYGRQCKEAMDQLPSSTASRSHETTEMSSAISNQDQLDADFWECDY